MIKKIDVLLKTVMLLPILQKINEEDPYFLIRYFWMINAYIVLEAEDSQSTKQLLKWSNFLGGFDDSLVIIRTSFKSLSHFKKGHYRCAILCATCTVVHIICLGDRARRGVKFISNQKYLKVKGLTFILEYAVDIYGNTGEMDIFGCIAQGTAFIFRKIRKSGILSKFKKLWKTRYLQILINMILIITKWI